MQVIVSVRHGRLNHIIQEQIQTKLQRLTRLSDRITEIDVIVDLKQPAAPSVEIQVSLERAGDLLAVVEANSVISAVDKVQHKLEQQLRKHKEKRTDHRLPTLGQLAWSSLTDEEFD